jgi:transcriptional regulator with XRE-family HTH domain
MGGTSMARKSRAVIPDGEKIKNLREASGRTVNELLAGSTVHVRNYQRAERGEKISPEYLQLIAALFKRSLSDLIRQDEKKDNSTGSQVRLHSCKGKGGYNIIAALQGRPSDVQFEFRTDPAEDAALRIAEIIKFCEQYTLSAGADDEIAEFVLLKSADFIKVVGQLNSKISDLLANSGINVFFGHQYYWYTELFGADDNKESDFFLPTLKRRVRIIFADCSDDFIREESLTQDSRERRFECCARVNIKNGIDPNTLKALLGNKAVWHSEFINYYRKYCAEATSRNPQTATAPLLLTKGEEK